MTNTLSEKEEKLLMENKEKRILKVSFIGCIIFLIAEFTMAIITDSKALLMDCIWDGSDLVMLIPMMILITLLKKPVSERRPYGFSQVESILLVIKSAMLIVITGMLVVDGIESIIRGGNMVDGGLIAIYQLTISVICGITYVYLKKQCNSISSPTAEAEIFIWKLDSMSTLGVSIGFAIQFFIMKTSFAGIGPYIDPAIAIIMAVVLIKEPLKIAIENIRNLMLFAPEREIREEVKEVVDEVFDATGMECSFLDLVQTGRKLWIEVFYKSDSDNIEITKLKEMRKEMEMKLKAEEYDDIYISIAPDLDI